LLFPVLSLKRSCDDRIFIILEKPSVQMANERFSRSYPSTYKSNTFDITENKK